MSPNPPAPRPPRSARLTSTKERPVPDAAPLGMAVFLASLSVLFVASLVGYAAVRAGAPEWPPAGAPPLPRTLWLSTLLLVASSGAIHGALVGARQGRQGLVRAGLLGTCALGLGFLGLQTLAWWTLAERMPPSTTTQYSFTFYMLTALHAAHVLGGLGPLGVSVVRGLRGRYGPEDHGGLRLVAMYWHFLDAVWLALFAVLYLVG
ncbi:MAG: cytochrome c oxidase subunit 3 [Planctomycetes bacterium]|nr:cytochrome c oxidase subunit 3 [Planctomycetota bacterium]